ncbi:MAG: hypothetical protein AAF572_03005 [Cyanobacteria bacterium P01_B01_bin.77]
MGKESQLVKAKLIAKSGGKKKELVFMFNPKELSFSNQVQTVDNPGARAKTSGRPRVSFSDIPPKQLVIKDIWFDTYETGEDVLNKHLQDFIDAVTFTKNQERPPIYQFQWGPHTYLDYCFIEQLNYRLTKFMPNGVPVRAVIERLGLKEIEKPADSASKQRKSQPNPQNARR